MDYPDMRTPIQFALTYPTRRPSPRRRLDLTGLSGLTFEAPRLDDFPCLRLAYQAAAAGGTLPCVMNAANEIAVQRFLDGELSFLGIAAVVEEVMERHVSAPADDLESLLAADAWARAAAREVAA
jgi:1-deoxy-D-xylulose-5-phosphate reductoisomerase